MSMDKKEQLGRVGEATIMNILAKSLADKKLSQQAFDGLRYKLQSEIDLRIEIAERISVKFMPICVCERCDNLKEGRLVEDIVKLILEGN